MAFAVAKLVGASASFDKITPRVWLYSTTADAIATVSAANYFLHRLLKANDVIIARCTDGTVILAVTAASYGASTSTTAAVAVGGNSGRQTITTRITDISTAGSYFVVSPIAGKIYKVYTVLQGAITVADSAVTLEIGGTAVTDGGITIATAGSAAGVVDSCTPSALNTVTAGGAIEVITDGGSTGTVAVDVTIIIDPS